MKNPESKCGTYGWVALATGVALWDIYAPETLSEAVDRALDHKYMKYIAWGVGGIVTGHLFNVLPNKLDPIHQLGKIAGMKYEQ